MSNKKSKGGMSNLGAAAVGVAVGAAAGVAAVILSDEKKRKQISQFTQKVAGDIKEKASDASGAVGEKVEEGKEILADKLEKVAKKLDKKI